MYHQIAGGISMPWQNCILALVKQYEKVPNNKKSLLLH